MKIHNLISTFCTLLLFTLLNAVSGFSQNGWEKTYFNETTALTEVIQTADGGYVALGGGFDSVEVLVMKVDANGVYQWGIHHSDPAWRFTGNAIEKATGGYIVAGFAANPSWTTGNGFLMKLDDLGNVLWVQVYDLPNAQALADVTELPDGTFWAVGSELWLAKNFILHADASGNLLSQQTYAPFNPGYLLHTSLTTDGGFYAAGWDENHFYNLEKRDAAGVLQNAFGYSSSISELASVEHAPGDGFFFLGFANDAGQPSFVVTKLDEQGDGLWSTALSATDLGFLTVNSFGLQKRKVAAATDGGCFLTLGSVELTQIVKLNADGSLAWTRPFPHNALDNKEYLGIEGTTDGGCIAAGFYQNDFGPFVPQLLKLNSDGFLFGNVLSGNVFQDDNQDCTFNGIDLPAKGYIVKASNLDNDFYASTNANGDYEMGLPNGDFTVTAYTPLPFGGFCENNVPLTVADDNHLVDFADTTTACAMLDVSMYSWTMRRCNQNKYMGRVCNVGYAMAENAYLEVMLDSWLTYNFSTPAATQNGQLLTLQLGNILPGGCVDFVIFFNVDCDAPPGLTHCSQAHAYPDEWCGPSNPDWDGSSVQLSAECIDNETIRFTIENVGTGDMQDESNFIVIEDHMIMMTEPFQLSSGNSQFVDIEADGSTYRLEADQCPGHPGFSYPTAVVEGCGLGLVPNISTGFVNMYPMDDANIWMDEDCRSNTSPYDPNQKEAFPEGYLQEHSIKRSTELEYLIQFQNTGTDTALTVVVRDTLSLFLNPATIRPGASSHPYEFDLSGNGVLTFTFPDIMLPDSNVNEPMSHGFVSFRIAQQPDNPLGSVIKNSAAIFFDFNAPIITNETFHTVDSNFITVSIVNFEPGPGMPATLVKVMPNPFSEQAFFEVEGFDNQPLVLKVFDAKGGLVRSVSSANSPVKFRRDGLSEGLYFFSLATGDGEVLGRGKMVVR